MKVYILSLAVGLLVGVIYNLIGVRSPAPPVVALVGLLGILVGEQLPPIAKAFRLGQPWLHQIEPHPKADRSLSPPAGEQSTDQLQEEA